MIKNLIITIKNFSLECLMYLKYFILFKILLIYCLYLYSLFYFNILLNDSNINTLILLIKKNGCLCIKFAQWYSSRINISSNKKLYDSFSQFYENNDCHSLEYTKQIYYETTNNNILDYLIFNNEKPIASGSIAQVYDCTIVESGKRVALKVQHPLIKYQIYFPKKFIKFVTFILKYFESYIFIPFKFDHFFNSLDKQLDFNEEGNNLDKFKNNFRDNKLIIIPEKFFSNEKIIIMSYEEGCHFEEIKNITYYQKYKISYTLLLFTMQSFVIDGFIHGDLHDGNWKVRFNNELNEYQLIIYDTGIVNIYDNKFIQDLFYFYDTNNPKGLIKIFIDQNYINQNNNKNNINIRDGITTKLTEIINRPFDMEMILKAALQIFKENCIKIESNFLTLLLTMSLTEKHFKKYDLMGEKIKNEKNEINYDILNYNDYSDRINFCETKNCFLELSKYYKFLLKKIKEEKKINSFTDLSKTTNLKFLDISKFCLKKKEEDKDEDKEDKED